MLSAKAPWASLEGACAITCCVATLQCTEPHCLGRVWGTTPEELLPYVFACMGVRRYKQQRDTVRIAHVLSRLYGSRVRSGMYALVLCAEDTHQYCCRGRHGKGVSLLPIIGEKLVACKAWFPLGNSTISGLCALMV